MGHQWTASVVAVSRRATAFKQHCCAAQLSLNVLAVQDGPAWPQLCSPVLLDMHGIADSDLLQLLAHPPTVPLLVLADPARYRALTLLALTPTVRMVCADLHILARWIPLLPMAIDAPHAPPLWLMPKPLLPPLDPQFVPVLAALWCSSSYRSAATRCGLSESTLYRIVRSSRTVLQLPAGAVTRFSPHDLAICMFERLCADGLPLPAP